MRPRVRAKDAYRRMIHCFTARPQFYSLYAQAGAWTVPKEYSSGYSSGAKGPQTRRQLRTIEVIHKDQARALPRKVGRYGRTSQVME